MDPTIIAAIIGAIATIAAVFIGWILHLKKERLTSDSESQPSVAAEQNVETEAKKYVRRYLDYPSHYRFIWSLPKLRRVVHENAQEGWDTGITADMREASYDVINFLEYSWLRLAQFYPEDHWGGKDAEAYISNFIQDRFTFHWSKHEPDGPGTGGTIVGVLAGSDVIRDLESLIVETVSALFLHKDDFDFGKWNKEWHFMAE